MEKELAGRKNINIPFVKKDAYVVDCGDIAILFSPLGDIEREAEGTIEGRPAR